MTVPLGKPEACAKVSGADGLYGSVCFYKMSGGVLVVAQIFGLPQNKTGFFGFHIHAGESCTGAGFADTGGHYNPQNAAHPLHAGDLPPLLSCGGRAFAAVLTDRFSVDEILGKTVVIHSQPDDFKTQPAGDAGEKIGCGIIEVM